MPLYHKTPIYQTGQFLPLPYPSYVRSASEMNNTHLHNSLGFVSGMLNDVLGEPVNDFQRYCRAMWSPYKPALFRYGLNIARELESRGDLNGGDMGRLELLRPNEPYKQPCFFHSRRVHISSQGYLKYMNNCWAIEYMVDRLRGPLGYSNDYDYNEVIRQVYDFAWTTLPQETPGKVARVLRAIEQVYPSFAVSGYPQFTSRCEFHFVLLQDAWLGISLQTASRYMRSFGDAYREFRTRNGTYIQRSNMGFTEETVTRRIRHLDGNETWIDHRGITRLYGVNGIVRGCWPEVIEETPEFMQLLQRPGIAQLVDRAYVYDAVTRLWNMRDEVRSMVGYERSEDRMHRVNAQQWAHSMRIRGSETQHFENVWENPDARRTDSSTDQVDEGSDAGTESNTDSSPIHATDRGGVESESTV